MTQAEKARAYDEAIKRAKEINNEQKAQPFDVMLKVFPELKESEDEKIRKRLLEYFKSFTSEVSFNGVSANDVLAWIEKQGEPMEINPTEFDTRLQTLIGKFDSLPKEELVGSLSFWLNVVQNDGTYKAEEKQGEQNPIINAPSREVILAIWDLGNEWKELTKGSISTEYGTQLNYIQKHWEESEYYLREKQGKQNTEL